MRISLVIDSDSLDAFIGELRQLQAISLDGSPAKVVAAVAAATQKPKDPHKEPEPERKDEPEKEPARTEPPVEEQQPAAAQAPVEAKKRRGRPKKEEPTQAAPAAPAAPVEEVTQVAPKTNGKQAIFTRDDLTAAFKEYVVKFGYAAASSDVSKMLQQAFGAGVRKSSDVGDDHIAAAIDLVKKAVNDNPFSRKVEANG